MTRWNASSRRHRWINRLQTLLMVVLLLAVSSFAGFSLLGEPGLWLALGGALFALFFEPLATWRLTLALYRARPIYPVEAPELWQMTRLIAERAELSTMPQLFYVPSPVINAFAVGSRQQPAIALSDGLLRQLTQRELAGVLAHEIAHIVHGDLKVMGLADYVSRLTHLFAVAGQLMIVLSLPLLFFEDYSLHFNLLAITLLLFSPHLAVLAQLGLSRVREYDADLTAAMLTGDPMGLAFALARIERVSGSWLAILLPGWGNPEPSWLRSHPSTALRIKRLQEYAVDVAWQKRFISDDLPLNCVFDEVPRSPRWRLGGLWR